MQYYRCDNVFKDRDEDPDLEEKLTTSVQLSGLLNWALRGLKELIDTRGFHDRTVEQIRQDYEENTNHVDAFDMIPPTATGAIIYPIENDYIVNLIGAKYHILGCL